jgi:L-threonylcarbamoyladenylate synthase
MTDVIRIDPNAIDRNALAAAAERLRAGGLVAFPTETVYGLGAHALDRDAVRRLFAAKGRPANDPLIVHVASRGQVDALVREVPAMAQPLMARFWPGPLTLVMPRAAAVPDEVTAGLDTVAIRIPSAPVARALLELAAIPVAAPSANLFSRPSPTRASHVLDDLRDRIDIVIDGGRTPVGIESTVVDITGEQPVILRPGGTSIDDLRSVLRNVVMREQAMPGTAAMPAPGMLEKHYAPRAPMTLYEGEHAVHAIVAEARLARNRGQRVGILAADEDRRRLGEAGGVEGGPPVKIVTLGRAGDADAIAAQLYHGLRELDAAEVDLILARDFPVLDERLGPAITNRLRRAAGRRIAT